MPEAAAEPLPKIAVFLSFSGQGGVEKMVGNLLLGFSDSGAVQVDLLAIARQPLNPDLVNLPRVQVRLLKSQHSTSAIAELASYLRRERPAALLVAKERAIRTAVLARWLVRSDVRIVGRLGTHLSTALQGKSALKRWVRILPMRWLYPYVDCMVAVSEGVAEDTRRLARLPHEQVTVIRNPVVSPRMFEQSRTTPEHPWLNDHNVPVLLAIGRLTEQKDFPTLIRAFQQVRSRIDCRLVILGEGRLRQPLVDLINALGLSDVVDLPGFRPNPYGFIRRADLFVLSSAWEGSPNVLTEALALGRPTVATDCASGPNEILQKGRFGPLVPVGDTTALASAIINVLMAPPKPEIQKQAVLEYTLSCSAANYLKILGISL